MSKNTHTHQLQIEFLFKPNESNTNRLIPYLPKTIRHSKKANRPTGGNYEHHQNHLFSYLCCHYHHYGPFPSRG